MAKPGATTIAQSLALGAACGLIDVDVVAMQFSLVDRG
tara:strand:+ start:675 stop:788 length:114 start_codon:yes stop_codon:yes gene_type:complete